VEERFAEGDIHSLIERMGTGPGEDVGRFYLGQMARALEFIHANNCVHRNVELESFGLDQNLNIKLKKFAWAEMGKHISQMTSKVGTERSMAPEILRDQVFDGRQADIFSLGYVLFCVIVGHPPFELAIIRDPRYKYLHSNDEKGKDRFFSK